MKGLGKRNRGNATYLNIQGGAIWQKKGFDENDELYDEYYTEESWETKDGKSGVRKGLKFSFIEAMVEKFWFYEGKYGEMINIGMDNGERKFVLSSDRYDRHGVDLMKMLLSCDLTKPVDIEPYQFTGDKGNQVKGTTVQQDGKKVDLAPNPEDDQGIEFLSGEEIKKLATKKRERYFEDIADEIKKMVMDKCADYLSEKEDSDDEPEEKPKKRKAPAKKSTTNKTGVTREKMIKRLTAYIEDEYGDDVELPDLDDNTLNEWYELSKNDEPLPFDDINDESPEENDYETEHENEKTDAKKEVSSTVARLRARTKK